MKTTTAVTQKGQITIPKKIRDKFGIEVFEKVFIEPKKDYIKITPTFDILDIAGKLKPKKKKSIIKAREQIEKSYKRV